MTILIDNGHGVDTPGKRSPDGRLMEYSYNRWMAAAVVEGLTALGYDSRLLVPEVEDIPLAERCRRVNGLCQSLGRENVMLISLHVNAAGSDGEWHNGCGWSAYTTVGETPSDRLALYLYEAAKSELAGRRIRLFNGALKQDWEANFYILRKVLCRAVLTENLFMDNLSDVEYLLSPAGFEAIVKLHVVGVSSFLLTL